MSRVLPCTTCWTATTFATGSPPHRGRSRDSQPDRPRTEGDPGRSHLRDLPDDRGSGHRRRLCLHRGTPCRAPRYRPARRSDQAPPGQVLLIPSTFIVRDALWIYPVPHTFYLQTAVSEDKLAEAAGDHYHPAANAAFGRLTAGRSSRIQYESLLENVRLAEKLMIY